jgi:hypothetical protein
MIKAESTNRAWIGPGSLSYEIIESSVIKGVDTRLCLVQNHFPCTVIEPPTAASTRLFLNVKDVERRGEER